MHVTFVDKLTKWDSGDAPFPEDAMSLASSVSYNYTPPSKGNQQNVPGEEYAADEGLLTNTWRRHF